MAELMQVKCLPCLDGWKEAAFVGYFGPIGVGTLYWTSEALEYLPDTERRAHLREVLMPINYFLIVFSVLVHGTSISFFQASRTVIGKGHPKPKDDPPIPIRPGADLYITPSRAPSRGDLSLSRVSTRRQSAREYLARHISIPSLGDARPDQYRSQLDLALERSNTRRQSARDLDRTATLSPSLDAERDSDEGPKFPMSGRSRTFSQPAHMEGSHSIERSRTQPVPPTIQLTSVTPTTSDTAGLGSSAAARKQRRDWLRRGRIARGEAVGDEESDHAEEAGAGDGKDASDRV
jgi:hypothetical protein